MNRNNTYVWIGVVVLLIVVVGGIVWAQRSNESGDAPQGKLPTGSDIETFSGTISAVDTGCFADAICSVTVDGKRVILAAGLRMQPIPPVGRLLGVESIGDLEQHIGNHANVYATTTPEGDYTLYGSEDYYVEVIDTEPGATGAVERYRTTLTGVHVCLPHKDTTGPQTLECALGMRTDAGEYYALDFNMLSRIPPDLSTGERFSATGLVTPVEMLSSDHWQKYQMKGILSVTDSTRKL